MMSLPLAGLGPVPRWYTILMNEVYLPMRQRGVCLAFLIDDQVNLAPTLARAAAQGEAVARLLIAVGFWLNPKKCQLRPSQLLQFLGMMIDTVGMRFFIPEQKLESFRQETEALWAAEQYTLRELARVAGKLISFQPAVSIAPVLARGLFMLMKGHREEWDKLFDSSDTAVEALKLCVHMVLEHNGSRMMRRGGPTVVLVGDASDTTLSCFTPNGELPYALVRDLTPEQIRAVGNDELSSTHRECLWMLTFFRLLLGLAPHLVEHKGVQFHTDSQAGRAAVLGMGGCADLFPIVRELWLLASKHDIEIDVVWYPRNLPLQQLADILSKIEDRSQWQLDQRVYVENIYRPVKELLNGVRINFDLFADDQLTKVPNRFYSRFMCPGSQGVDAFKHAWAWDVKGGEFKRRLCFCNPPFGLLAEVIAKIVEERVDVVLIYPEWKRKHFLQWRDALDRLAPFIRWQVELPRVRGLFRPGPRAGREVQGRLEPPRYAVHATLIVWPHGQRLPPPMGVMVSPR